MRRDLKVAAVATGVGVSTMRRWIRQGWLQAQGSRPTMVCTDEVRDVRERTTRARLANLRQYSE